MDKKISSFESIIPTAITVLYPRIFTDIPYSNEIFSFLKSQIEVDSYLPKDILAVELEARYKLMDRLLKKTNIKQVLELAAGYSSRGLIFSKDYGYRYIELELQKVADLKEELINSISDKPSNLHIISGNATDKLYFDKCKVLFNPNEKLVVINEGLLRYLDFDEKRQVAENVFGILKEMGGGIGLLAMLHLVNLFKTKVIKSPILTQD